MRTLRAFGLLEAAALALTLAACTHHAVDDALPLRPVPLGAIEITAEAVSLNTRAPTQTQVGQLTWAGGVRLRATGTSRFGGLSDIDVAADGRTFLAVTDEGDLLRGNLELDGAGRLVGLAVASVQPLTDAAGRPFASKREADAEDISIDDARGDGTFSISFERDHRVLTYAPDGRARVTFRPDPRSPLRLGDNEGLEALSQCPGDGTLQVGSEGGQVVSFADGVQSRRDEAPRAPRGFRLTAMDCLEDVRRFALYRAWDPLRGWRALVAHHVRPGGCTGDDPCDDRFGLETLATLARPLTVDNFEGLAAVDRPDGSVRLYLLSDDNFSQDQRTLLLAFDYTPGTTRPAARVPPP